jgi:probable HAF family extracellular repeat protein
MKKYLLVLISICSLCAAVAIPLVSSAQNTSTQNQTAQHHHYILIDIPTLGGPTSSFAFAGDASKIINSQGTAVAQADTSTPDPFCLSHCLNCTVSAFCFFDCFVSHPVQRLNGVLTDLGALPGVNSSGAFWINSQAWAAGLSENGVIDPLTGFPETDAVLWKDGNIINLGTFGGNVSAANAVNDLGQVVGGALNTIPDSFPTTFTKQFLFEAGPFYFFPVATQSHAFLWQDGRMQDLGTLGGPDSVAWFVNEFGQVAGQSTINSIPNPATGVPTVDAFFGDHGKMVDVGNLGGPYSFVAGLNNFGQMTGTIKLPGPTKTGFDFHAFFWDRGVLTDMATLGGNFGLANRINDAGEVVGFSTNEDNHVLGFLWKDGVITNLGTVDGDKCSAGHDLNSIGQVVGESTPSCFSGTATHAFLWENGGPIVDLNTLVIPGSQLDSAGGFGINDLGEITGDRFLPDGDKRAFILIPCDANHPNVAGRDYSLVDAATVQNSAAPIPAANAPATPTTLTPSEMQDGIRTLLTKRNRRFGPLAPK